MKAKRSRMSQKLVIPFLFCCILHTGWSQKTDSSTIRLDIPTLFDLVVANNPSLKVAQSGITVADQAVEVSKNNRLPNANVGLSAFYLGNAVPHQRNHHRRDSIDCLAGFDVWNMAALGYNALVNADLGLWGIPGLIAGGALGFIGFKKDWNIKYYILLGFGAFFMHSLLIYFIIQPNMNIEMFYLPVMIRNFGMVILFIGVWFYATNNLPMSSSLGVISILLSFRTFVATGIASAIISFVSYQMQWQSLTDMSNYWDSNLLGPAAMRGYGSMQIGALLASGKTLMGWMCWLFVPVTLLILSHDYGKPKVRKRFFLRKKNSKAKTPDSESNLAIDGN